MLAAAITPAIAARGPASAADEERPPNVLIIVSDDQRWGTLDGMPETRRIFGEGGLTYANAFVTTPLCCPSRASILTGRYAHNHGVVRNGHDDALDYSRAMPAVLQAAGYRTGVVGKLSNAWQAGETPPYFDDVSIKWPHPAYAEDHLAHATAEFVADGEADDERPWMLWVGARAPHTPLLTDPEYEGVEVPARISPGQVEADLSDKPRFVRREVEEVRRTLGDEFDFTEISDQLDFEVESRRELLSLDAMVAEVFATLERSGEADDTLAFFISDNGYLAGEHGGLARKHLPYMEAIRVPLLMRWPGHVPEGLESRKLVANIDLAPTVYDAAGIEPGYTVDGRSLLSRHERPYLLIERLVGGNWPRFTGIVTRKLHYIETLRSGSLRPRSQELYDRFADPYQLENLATVAAARAEDELADLRALVGAIRDCAGQACP